MTAREWLDKKTEGYLEIFHDVMYENVGYTEFEDRLIAYIEGYVNYLREKNKDEFTNTSN